MLRHNLLIALRSLKRHKGSFVINLVGLSMLVAFPLSWWAMNVWLDGFAYRINIDGWVFFFAGVAMIVLTICTVGYQSLKAALMNPVSSLRNE